VSRAARDQSQQQLWGGRRRVFNDVRRVNVLRLVRCGHSRAPFQNCAVSMGLEKAVKEMLRLMEKYRGGKLPCAGPVYGTAWGKFTSESA
jgi:hypothetical protein